MYKICDLPLLEVICDENFLMQSYKVQCLWFHMFSRADVTGVVRDTYMLSCVLNCNKSDFDTLEMNGFIHNVTV